MPFLATTTRSRAFLFVIECARGSQNLPSQLSLRGCDLPCVRCPQLTDHDRGQLQGGAPGAAPLGGYEESRSVPRGRHGAICCGCLTAPGPTIQLTESPAARSSACGGTRRSSCIFQILKEFLMRCWECRKKMHRVDLGVLNRLEGYVCVSTDCRRIGVLVIPVGQGREKDVFYDAQGG